MVMKLVYFAAPGRAEATRMMLTIGNIPFEDEHVDRAAWPSVKATTPQEIAQSGAIERYIAKMVGLYPKDPLTAAFADQAAFLINEIVELLSPTFYLTDVVAKIKARHELMAGKMKDKLLMLQKYLEHQPYLAGKELCFVDFVAFSFLGSLRSGDYDGISTTILDDFPGFKPYFERIASIDAIKARYAHATGSRAAYRVV